MTWIKTAEKIPEEYKDCLFTNGENVYMGYFAYGKFNQNPAEDQFYGTHFQISEITHWMELPKLPK